MKPHWIALAVFSALLSVTRPASACGAEQIAVQQFQSEVDTWSDGSGKAVRLAGYLSNPCNATIGVSVGITEYAASGRMLGMYHFWIDGVPPNGKPFELLDSVPYRADAVRYEAGVIRLR